MSDQDLVTRLRKRAEIRRQISTRKSVQEGKPDRIADLLEEAAADIESLRNALEVIELSAIAVLATDLDPKKTLDAIQQEADLALRASTIK